MPRYRSDGETQYEIDPMTGKVVGDGAKIPPRGGPRFRTKIPPAVLDELRSYGNRQRSDLPVDIGPLGEKTYWFPRQGGTIIGWPGGNGYDIGRASLELPLEKDPFSRAAAPLDGDANPEKPGFARDAADGVDMGPTAPSIPMEDLAGRFQPGPRRMQFDANADSPEPVDMPPERPVDMLREPNDGMAPVGLRAIPDASRTPTLRERMMIAQTRAAADKDQERAAGAAGLAVGMRGMPNQSSGFLDIDPTDPTRLLPEREQDVRNMTRADRAIGGADMRDQNTDSIWSAGGRKYPTLSMDELQRYVAEKKAKEGKQIGDLDVAGAKQRLKDRMDNPRMERRSGPMQSKLQQQYKDKRDARQAKDAYGNAAKMTASSNPRRQRAGQALLDAIQSGPGGGGQDGTGMSANSIAREGMHAARAAALRGASPAEQRVIYETTVKAAINNQEAMQQRLRDKEGRDFTLERDRSSNEFSANQKELDRKADLEKAEIVTGGKSGNLSPLERTMAFLATLYEKTGKGVPSPEVLRAEAERHMAAGTSSPMPGLPADPGPMSELDRVRAEKAAYEESVKKEKKRKVESGLAKAEKDRLETDKKLKDVPWWKQMLNPTGDPDISLPAY